MAITVRKGFDDSQRGAISAVYWAAFGRKFAPLLGDPVRAQRVIASAFDPAYALTAIDEDGRVMGVCGMEYEGGIFVRHRLEVMRAEYGWIGGLWRWLLVAVFHTEGDGKTVYISGLAVHPDARGQGVGTLLIDAVAAFARERGYTAIRLHVVNSNAGAQRLYERLGFTVTGRDWLPFLWWMGFTGVNAMVKPIR